MPVPSPVTTTASHGPCRQQVDVERVSRQDRLVLEPDPSEEYRRLHPAEVGELAAKRVVRRWQVARDGIHLDEGSAVLVGQREGGGAVVEHVDAERDPGWVAASRSRTASTSRGDPK